MSIVVCSDIRDLSENILVPSYGSVISSTYIRYDAKDTFVIGNYAVLNNTNRIPGLRLTINASHPNNIIIAQWQLSLEVIHDCTFSVLKNLSLVDGSFGGGQSTAVNNNYWKGYVSAYYDNDQASTPSNIMLQWMGRAGVKGNVDLDVVANFSSSTGTLYMNRTVNSAGQDGYENGVCTGVAFEITSQGGEG